jgi:hypothetical protein
MIEVQVAEAMEYWRKSLLRSSEIAYGTLDLMLRQAAVFRVRGHQDLANKLEEMALEMFEVGANEELLASSLGTSS